MSRPEDTITIKTAFIVGLTFLFLSCGQQTEKQTLSEEPIADMDTLAETANRGMITKFQTDGIHSPNQRELNKALEDSTIDEYYKEIYRQEKLIATDEVKMLSITEKLFSKDPDKDLFYFIVFTKSMNGSDGFYSEAVGLSALKFVTDNTEQFTDYFNVVPELTNHDLDNWANYIYGEIQISRENEEEKVVKALEKKLLENIKETRKEYKNIIEQFIDKIRKRML